MHTSTWSDEVVTVVVVVDGLLVMDAVVVVTLVTDLVTSVELGASLFI